MSRKSLRQRCPNPARFLSPLCRQPVLTGDEESRLFAELQAARRRLERSETAHAEFHAVRNRIVTANLRLLVSIAGQFRSAEWTVDELASAGVAPLIRAVELFDPSRGWRFSTYATHAIRNYLMRVRRRRSIRNARECRMPDVAAESGDSESPVGSARLELAEDLHRLREAVRELPERDRLMVSARFGLGEFAEPSTFRQMAAMTGLSRERVRVLTHRALQRLRESLQRSAA